TYWHLLMLWSVCILWLARRAVVVFHGVVSGGRSAEQTAGDRRAFQAGSDRRSELLPPRSRRLLPASARGGCPEPAHRGPGEAAGDLQERPRGVSRGIRRSGTNFPLRCRHRRQEHGPGRDVRRWREMGERSPVSENRDRGVLVRRRDRDLIRRRDGRTLRLRGPLLRPYAVRRA